MNHLDSPELDFPQHDLRRCPWCNSFDTSFVHRGYTGPTDEIDQYFVCNACNKTTFELIAKTAREMRLGRFRAGGTYRDAANGTRYQVTRVLKVGINEYLVYLRPMVPGNESAVHS
jgi:transposase-like protein